MTRFLYLALASVFAMTFLAGNPARAAGDKLVIELKTGKVVIQLRPDLAPKHVERVKTLASQGFYNGLKWHRVIDGFMAQTGDPTGTGMGGSKLPDLPAEFATFAAYWDFATGLLAMLALATARMRPLFLLFVIAFNLVGFVDILVDYYDAIQTGVPDMAGRMGAAYAIPVLYVPILMITHVTAFYLLLRAYVPGVLERGRRRFA